MKRSNRLPRAAQLVKWQSQEALAVQPLSKKLSFPVNYHFSPVNCHFLSGTFSLCSCRAWRLRVCPEALPRSAQAPSSPFHDSSPGEALPGLVSTQSSLHLAFLGVSAMQLGRVPCVRTGSPTMRRLLRRSYKAAGQSTPS